MSHVARVGSPGTRLFDVHRAGSHWSSKTKSAWGFARAGQLDRALFVALASAAGPRLGEFNAQDLSNTAWAFAKAGQLDEALFAALAKAAESRLGEFNEQGLANTA